jgi:AcrR family transcriptional regulator
LIESARSIFAEVGYQAATTRQICISAHANAAAVNYHFGDKLGLYRAVLVDVTGDQESRPAWAALLTEPPETALRKFIVMMFESMTSLEGADPYVKLMAHELSQPTPGLVLVVEQMIRPRALLLCAIVAKIIGRPERSALTERCAQSILAQMVHPIHSRPVIKLLFPERVLGDNTVDATIEHITEFSLAALGVLAGRPGKAGGAKRRPPAKSLASAKGAATVTRGAAERKRVK